jgi:3-oxoacyl-[acyl-carrier-protein] synthase III
MITAENCKAAMIVAAECENNADSLPGELVDVRETGSALILDSDPSNHTGFSRFLFRYHTDSLDAYTTNCNCEERIPYLHVRKDSKLETLYIDCILPAVKDLLQMEGLDLNQIDMIFPPQISSGFITRLSNALNLPRERFVDVVGEGPDFFTSSLPYSMEFAYEKGIVKSGNTGLVIAVGSGIQAGCAIYHF